MPGMLERFDAHAKSLDAQIKAEEAAERAYRERQGELARAGWERLMGMLVGEPPTRETTEEWMLRRDGMLERLRRQLAPINARPVPRSGPLRRPQPRAITVRG